MTQNQSLDILWMLVCAALVFVMQGGFLCLESGLTRAKNAINVAVKNIADFAVASILFWLFGFGLMFGDSVGGLFGTGYFAMSGEAGASTWLMAFVLFQMMFCATAATIVSGAVAERMHFPAYVVVSAVVAGLIYPVFGHWAWGGVIGDGEAGWLAAMGFIDFAGSTVVHSTGGWVALAAVMILGAREGRFVPGEPARVIPAGNLPVAMLGGLLLFFGWFGFNGGSTLAFTEAVPAIMAHTALAAAAGILAGILIGWKLHGYCEVMYALNGAVAGLVSITACAHVVSGLDAIVIGAIGSVIMVIANEWLLARRIDDAVSAIPAHLAAGAWGTLCVALFGDLSLIGNGLSRFEQLGVQALGVLACGVWSFGIAWLVLRALGRFRPLRVSPEDERLGLNVSEHGARTELVQLMETMEEHSRTGLLTNRVPVEPFTEVGQIASAYNRVIGALEEATEQTRAVIRDVRDGIITFTREGVLTSLNPGAEKLFGVAASGVIGQPVQRLVSPEGSAPQPRLERLFVPGEKLELRFGAPRERRVLEVSISENRVGQVAQLTGMVRDISERKQVESQLHKERDLAQVTLASIGDGVITTDESGCVQYMNPVAERLTGWRAHEARGNPVSMIYRLIDEKSGALIENPVRTALHRGQVMPRLEHALLRRRDGENVPVLDTAAPIRSREGFLIGAVLVFHDVTVTLNLARELSHQASHDALTGVPNRREFERRLSELLGRPFENGQTHYLCYLDLDQFKVVNDTCGHVAGDELLRQVTGLLRTHLRASDLLARLGGDEFGLILQGCPRERALELAETFREAIQEFRFAWESKVFSIGVSIGVVEIESHESDLGAVLSSADAACYAAKEGGRNRVHLFQPDDDSLLEQHGQMQWVTRLQAALDQDRLRLYVQPIVPLNAPDRNRMHFEILVRLEENGKIIQPGAFLPAAERYNLMPRIDQWVVNNTLAWLGDSFRRHGRLDGVYCINLSGASLSDERFRQTLRTTLEQSGLPHGAICFEITETAAVANLSKVVHFIHEVKQLGCAFSLDDFGCGLSSFAYLKTLPVDFLKIDGSFIRDIETDPIDMAMVQAINTIGHTMGLQTIAEFVETESVMNRLIELGLDYAQGYLLGEPRPLGEGDQVRMMPR